MISLFSKLYICFALLVCIHRSFTLAVASSQQENKVEVVSESLTTGNDQMVDRNEINNKERVLRDESASNVNIDEVELSHALRGGASSLEVATARRTDKKDTSSYDLGNPDSVYMDTYSVNGKDYYCIHKLYSTIDMFTCNNPPATQGAGSDPPFGNGKDEPIVIVPMGVDWKEYCGTQCLMHALTYKEWPCLGYSYDSVKKNCVLKRCNPGSPESTMVNNKNKKVIDQYVHIGDTCARSMEGTPSPTKRIRPTATPTTRPTKSPSAPSKFTTQAPVVSDGFVSPSSIPRSYPVKWELYQNGQTPITLNTNLCEVASTRPGNTFRRYDNWLGNLDDCVKECTYDSGCKFALYASKAKVCIKALDVYVIDDETRITSWLSEGWVAYAKTTQTGVIPYVSGWCAGYRSPGECNSDSQCGWNKGRQGENHMVLFMGGYCGRVKCVVPSSL